MPIHQEKQEILTIAESSTIKNDKTTVHLRPNNYNIKMNVRVEETRFKFSKKRKLYRIGAANILKCLLDFPRIIDENIVEILPSSMMQKRSNVARRGKPFRPQDRGARFNDPKSPNSNPETLTELVSERNFCNSLLNNKSVPSNVKSFIESRMTYLNFKLQSLV